MPPREIKYTVVHFHQPIYQPPSLPFLEYIMSSIVGQVLFKLHFNYIYTSPARKLTRQALIAIQVICYICNATLQQERSHNLICVHALCYIMLMEKSGVLETCQHFSAQQYSSIQQTDLAVKKIFSRSITTIHPSFKLKTSAPVRTGIGKCD